MTNLTPVVSASWLAEHLESPEVAIADCRFTLSDPGLGQRQYQAGHIPGASFFDLNQDLSSPVQVHGGRHPLPDPAVLAPKLGALGIDTTNPAAQPLVVAYDDSRLAFAARFWWLLRYLGYNRVAVLDGGFAGWQRAGLPITTEVPAAKPGRFIPQVRSNAVVDIQTVKARNEGTVLIDSREGPRYRGEEEPIDPIAGHIPGAVNYPWQEVTTPEGYVRSPQDQRQRWANLQQAPDVMVYCGSGVTACVNLLSMHLAGIETGRLYAGSWSDWCSYL